MLPNSQTDVLAYEAVRRSVVGIAKAYPANLLADFHSHPKAQLLYAVSGAMRVETRSTSFIIPPSTALILPAHITHSIFMDGPVDRRTLFIHESVANNAMKKPKVIAVTRLMRELIIEICKEPVDWELNGRGHFIAMLMLDEIERSNIVPVDLALPKDARLYRVVNAIKANPADKRCLADWAEFAGASERTLARLFRTETGLSFRQWRQQARLTIAMSLLTRGDSSQKVASISGFDNQSAFGVAFRKFFGMTPGQARKLSSVPFE